MVKKKSVDAIEPRRSSRLSSSSTPAPSPVRKISGPKTKKTPKSATQPSNGKSRENGKDVPTGASSPLSSAVSARQIDDLPHPNKKPKLSDPPIPAVVDIENNDKPLEAVNDTNDSVVKDQNEIATNSTDDVEMKDGDSIQKIEEQPTLHVTDPALLVDEIPVVSAASIAEIAPALLENSDAMNLEVQNEDSENIVVQNEDSENIFVQNDCLDKMDVQNENIETTEVQNQHLVTIQEQVEYKVVEPASMEETHIIEQVVETQIIEEVDGEPQVVSHVIEEESQIIEQVAEALKQQQVTQVTIEEPKAKEPMKESETINAVDSVFASVFPTSPDSVSSPIEGLKIGETIPENIVLENEDAQPCNITDLVKEKGAVIFLYPKANTPGCTTQACGFRDSYIEIENAGFQVFGLSKDGPSSQKSWKEKNNFPYHFICDPEARLIRVLGSSCTGGKVSRSHYVIGKGGKILDIKNPISPLSSPSEALQFIKSLI